MTFLDEIRDCSIDDVMNGVAWLAGLGLITILTYACFYG
jgi:hypothetical protein